MRLQSFFRVCPTSYALCIRSQYWLPPGHCPSGTDAQRLSRESDVFSFSTVDAVPFD